MPQRLLLHFIAARRVCFAGKGRPFCSRRRKARLFIIIHTGYDAPPIYGSLVTRVTLPFSGRCTDKGTSTRIHNKRHASCKSDCEVAINYSARYIVKCYLERACKSKTIYKRRLSTSILYVVYTWRSKIDSCRWKMRCNFKSYIF